MTYLPRQKLSLLPTDCPYIHVPVPSFILDPSVNQTSPLTKERVPVSLVQSSLPRVNLYLGSKLNAGFITSTPILNMGSDCWSTSKYCYVLDWDVCKTRLQRRCTANLAPLCTTSSSGARQISASTAFVGMVRIAPVIPKHVSLWTLLSFFLTLAVWQSGNHTKNAKVMDSLMIET